MSISGNNLSASETEVKGVPSPSTDSNPKSLETDKLGKAVVLDVLGPVIARISVDERPTPNEAEALSSIRKGFEDLIQENPSIGWKLVEGLLEGINE